MRERVLREAWALAAHDGWDRVRIADLEERAEVSRPSIHKEFGDRAGVGQALVESETKRHSPFIRAVLVAARGGTDALLPFLTSRAGPARCLIRT